jgi:hypothetical protein
VSFSVAVKSIVGWVVECRRTPELPFGALLVNDSNLRFEGSKVPWVVARSVRDKLWAFVFGRPTYDGFDCGSFMVGHFHPW